MKKVISGKDLDKIIIEAVNLICNPVESSIGPKGTNSIIASTDLPTFITNDGVTIARNVESEDLCINAILEILKESSIKTDELVGDGTTTSLVLVKSIIEESYKLINNGISKYEINSELIKERNEIVKYLKNISHKPSEKEKRSIAITSSGKREYGEIIYEVASKIKNKNGIKITTGTKENTKVLYFKGYEIDTIIASDYFFKDSNLIELKNPYILVTNNKIENLENISDIINDCLDRKKDLVILADDYDEVLINNVLSINYDNDLNIYLLKNPEYGIRKFLISQDIAKISGAKIFKEDYYFGALKEIKINKEKTTMCFDINAKDYVNKINLAINDLNDEFDIEFYQRRKSMLENGLALIEVGGKTNTEIRETKMHFDDAINAIFSLDDGVSLGGGISYLEVAEKLNEKFILKNILEKPFKKIIDNAMLDYTAIKNEIVKSNYKKVYNLITDKFENIDDTTVLDSTKVLISSLNSAISIASLLLTTNSLIINEKAKNIDLNHEFNI